MKRCLPLLAVAILFFPPIASYGGAEPAADTSHPSYTPEIDSLITLIDSSSGNEQLVLYIELLTKVYALYDLDIYMEFADRFLEAARANGDRKREALAYALKISTMSTFGVPESLFLEEAWNAMDFIGEIPGAEPHYFTVASDIVAHYIAEGNYEEGLRLAEKFYEEAREKSDNSGMVTSLLSMGEAYYSLELYEQAESALRECIALASDYANAGIKGGAYQHLAGILINLERYEDALELCRDYEAFLIRREAIPKAAKGEMNPHWFMNNLLYADVYSALEQYDLAAEYVGKAEAYPISRSGIGVYMLESTRMPILAAQGKYAEAERSLDAIDREYGEIADYRDRLTIMELRAGLYHDWGKYDKSSGLYQDYIGLQDSVQRVDMAEALNSLRTRYEVDKLEIQKEQQKRSFRITLIWLSVALALLCVIIVVIVFNARRLRAKNRSLLDRIMEQDKLEQENELLRAQTAGKDIPDEENGNGDGDKLGEIYLKLKEMMKDPAVFTDPGIGRGAIAEKLGTNEKYVFYTIRKYYDMSVSDYLTALRLNYARNLLSLPRDKRTIEAVALDAGFSSRSTFYRLFRDRYGMAPDEFRRLVADS